MIHISFPIAHHPSFRNPPTYVYLITLFLPEDDTSGVIPRRTMLRHAYHVSATRNFRLTPAHPPTPLRDFRPLIPTNPYASPLLCAPHHALARRATERSEEARQPARVDSPSHPSEPSFPTRSFHVKPLSIVHSRSRAPCSCRARAVSGVVPLLPVPTYPRPKL